MYMYCCYSVTCHFSPGSFATASCCRCKHRVDCDAIREDIMKQVSYEAGECMRHNSIVYSSASNPVSV